MAVATTDIKLYKSLDTNIDLDTANGGDIDVASEVVSGVLHNLFPQVRASDVESGITRWLKVFVKNTHGTDTAFNLFTAISKPTDVEDMIYFAEAINTDHLSDINTSTIRLYGIGESTTELSAVNGEISISVKNGVNIDDIFKVGDKITFFDKTSYEKVLSTTITSVDSGNSKLVLDNYVDITNGSHILDDRYICTSPAFANLTSGSYKGYWIKQVVPPFSTPMESPANNFMLNTVFDPE